MRGPGTRAATITTTIAVLAAAGMMSACHNGPSNNHDTMGVNTGGAAGQVMPSAADTIHHTSNAGATSVPGSASAATDTMRRDTTRRRP
jgi:hypothetical protein